MTYTVSVLLNLFFSSSNPINRLLLFVASLKAGREKKEPYLLPLQNVVLICWAFGVSNGARKEMRAGLANPLTLPLPL